MIRPWLAALFLFGATATVLPAAGLPKPIPVVLITDIGTDIDDSWALALALRSPELDLRLVLVDPANTQYRAAVAAKFLENAGRSDIPVALGDNAPVGGDNLETLAPWIDGFELRKYPGAIHRDGVEALIDTVRRSKEPITVIDIGPAHSLALALRQAPDLASKCRFVGMYGSFDVGYNGGPPSAETNVRIDPAAFREVLRAPWRDILLTSLDTCGAVSLGGSRYHSIWCDTGDPMLRSLIESYCIFAPRQNWMRCDYFTVRSSTLFDCVAVYLAYSEGRVGIDTVTFDVADDGYTRRSTAGPFKARVALRWNDLDGFEEHLTNRLRSPGH